MEIKRILFATTNPTKAARMRELVSHLPLEVISLADMNRYSQVIEDGNTPAENACKKVEYHYAEVRLPTVAIDSGLYIERFPENKQPGLFVRRINGTGEQITDEEMLRYYQQELDKVGGMSKGEWVTAIALKTSPDNLFCETFTSETMFSSQASDVLTLGEPLNSLQIDPVVGKYYSKMTSKERIKAQRRRASGIVDFMERYLDILL
jgi:8-oxo-dGTP diphosphatase